MPTAIDRDELQRLLREEGAQIVEVLPEAEFDEAIAHTVELFAEQVPPADRRSIVVFDTDKDIATVLPALRNILGGPGERH